jgi:hypothetical protein
VELSHWRRCSSHRGSCNHKAFPEGFQMEIVLPQLIECWDYRHVPSFLAIFTVFFAVLEFELRTLCLLDRCSTN